MLCTVLKTIDCYREYCCVSLLPLSSSTYLQRSIIWQLYFLGCVAKQNRPIGKVCFFSTLCINKHQRRLNLKHSQKVYYRNLQAMTQCFHPSQTYSTQSIEIYLEDILIKIQLDETVCTYLFPAKSLYMYRVPNALNIRSTKIVTAASGTGYSFQYS